MSESEACEGIQKILKKENIKRLPAQMKRGEFNSRLKCLVKCFRGKMHKNIKLFKN